MKLCPQKIIEVRKNALLAAIQISMKDDTPSKIIARAEFFTNWVLGDELLLLSNGGSVPV
jgi:hypothetical protein